jgi:hypothetical protein
MKTIFQFFIPTLLVLIFSSTSNAQSFPATETEVKEILCSGKWMLDSAGKGEKKTTAKEVMMDDVSMLFKNDGSYSMTMFGMDKTGKWKVNMDKKSVDIYEKKPEPKSFIKSIAKEKIIVSNPEDSDFVLIFKLVKG